MVTFKPRHEYKASNGLKFKDVSKTQQQYKDECDLPAQIEKLTRHLNMTGETLADYNNKGAMYGDFTQVPDFRSYQVAVADAKEKFNALPLPVKDKFGNDPTKLFDFLLDENNRDEAIKLGLVTAPIKEIKEDISVSSTEIKAPQGSSEASDTAI